MSVFIATRLFVLNADGENRMKRKVMKGEERRRTVAYKRD